MITLPTIYELHVTLNVLSVMKSLFFSFYITNRWLYLNFDRYSFKFNTAFNLKMKQDVVCVSFGGYLFINMLAILTICIYKSEYSTQFECFCLICLYKLLNATITRIWQCKKKRYMYMFKKPFKISLSLLMSLSYATMQGRYIISK